MLLNYLRKQLLKKQFFARQSWEPKNKIFKKNKFSHLNFEYKSYGNKNPNKFFYVIRRHPGAGFFSNLNFVIHHLLICDELKMVPIIDMENYQTFYNCKKKIKNTYNSWEYYFKPVSKYKLKDVYTSKNVILCDNRTSKKGFSKENYLSSFKYFNGFNNLDKRHKVICKKYIKINKDIINQAAKLKKDFKGNKVLGICFRGSDQKKSAYHPYTPTENQMKYATDFLLKKYKFNKIYLCTEDEDYLKFYKQNYNKFLLYQDTYRTTDKFDLFDNKNPIHRYQIGEANIIDMLVLASTNYMLFASSNIPSCAMFFSKIKIPYSIIDNGMKGNIFISQFSWYIKKNLPKYLGGFENKLIEKNK